MEKIKNNILMEYYNIFVVIFALLLHGTEVFILKKYSIIKLILITLEIFYIFRFWGNNN